MTGTADHAALAALRKARFNLDLAAYTHPSWVGPLAHVPDAALWRTSRSVSQWIASENGIDKLFDWRMKELDKRFFLMEPDEVNELALALGVGLQARNLSRQVRREAVRVQREAFGEEFLAFAFDEAPRYRLPAVASPAEGSTGDATALREFTHRLGAQTLWHILHCEWTAVRLRAALLFDKGWGLVAQPEPFAPGWRQSVRAFLVNGLVKKRLTPCAWLF